VTGFDIAEGLVENELAAALPADLLIVNPPRAGVDARVCDTVLDTPPARVIYVSCDPATLARDCARLASRYTMHDVRCFDMFPQTAHVETVVELRCATG
jgi:23S rRNA (uracil1939-C5)-methyltransferase